MLIERKCLTGTALGWVPAVREAGQAPLALALKTRDTSLKLCWEGDGGDEWLLSLLTNNASRPLEQQSAKLC